MNLVETIAEEPEEPFDLVQESTTSIYDDANNYFVGSPEQEQPEEGSSHVDFMGSVDSSILINELSDCASTPRESERSSFEISSDCNYQQSKHSFDIDPPREEEEEEEEFALCKFCKPMDGDTLKHVAQEPWPKDVKLFQPYEVEQILLPDNANCLAVQTFLKMCNLEYKVEPRANAEAMSPTGKVPFIKCGAFIVSELEGIVQFVGSKGISLTSDMSSENKSDMRAYMTLVNNVLGNAELYICWCDTETYTDVTKHRYGSIFPWPLNHLQTWSKRSEELKRLKVLGWYQKSIEEVYSDVETCCQALTDRLDGNEFFFGSKFTELDALVYAHIFALLTVPLPAHLGKIIKKFSRLVTFCDNVDAKILGRQTNLCPQEYNKSMRYIFNDLLSINTATIKMDSFQVKQDRDSGMVNDPSVSVKFNSWLLHDRRNSDGFGINYMPVKISNNNTLKMKPTELEALIFGHLYTILTTPLPNAVLANTVKNFPDLINLITRIEKQYFQRETQH